MTRTRPRPGGRAEGQGRAEGGQGWAGAERGRGSQRGRGADSSAVGLEAARSKKVGGARGPPSRRGAVCLGPQAAVLTDVHPSKAAAGPGEPDTAAAWAPRAVGPRGHDSIHSAVDTPRPRTHPRATGPLRQRPHPPFPVPGAPNGLPVPAKGPETEGAPARRRRPGRSSLGPSGRPSPSPSTCGLAPPESRGCCGGSGVSLGRRGRVGLLFKQRDAPSVFCSLALGPYDALRKFSRGG